MYPPPPPDIIARLVGQSVESITYGTYVMHVGFDMGDKVSIACPFRFCQVGAESRLFEFPLVDTNMLQAIGMKVDIASCDTDGTLRLTFAGGWFLIAYANDPAYEAYTILLGGKEYVV
jgi:hypothetical protein